MSLNSSELHRAGMKRTQKFGASINKIVIPLTNLTSPPSVDLLEATDAKLTVKRSTFSKDFGLGANSAIQSLIFTGPIHLPIGIISMHTPTTTEEKIHAFCLTSLHYVSLPSLFVVQVSAWPRRSWASGRSAKDSRQRNFI